MRAFWESPPWALAAFVAAYTVFDILPISLPEADVLEGLSWGALVDAPLMFVLVAAYLLLGLHAGLWRATLPRLLGAVAMVLLVQGHGIHLAGNAIAGQTGIGGQAHDTTYFLDEHWGHAELHAGILLLALLFIAGSRGQAEPPSRAAALAVTALAVVYGLLLTGDAIEGQTVWLMLPTAVALSLLGRLRVSGAFSWHRSFFASSLTVTAIGLASYGVWKGGFPEHAWDIWNGLFVALPHL
jgi:hypothetical protein